MTTKAKVETLARQIIGRDVVNRRGLFHITEAKAEYSTYHKQWKIEAKCSVASHKICADNLVNGTQAMGTNVFMLTVEEAKKLIISVKPKLKPKKVIKTSAFPF